MIVRVRTDFTGAAAAVAGSASDIVTEKFVIPCPVGTIYVN
jgi:hypothetical protein